MTKYAQPLTVEQMQAITDQLNGAILTIEGEWNEAPMGLHDAYYIARDSIENSVEPNTWLYQHEDTGQIGYVNQWQVDNHFEENNPRLQLIHQLLPVTKKPEESSAEKEYRGNADTEKLLVLADRCSDLILGGERGWERMEFKAFVQLVADAIRKPQSEESRTQQDLSITNGRLSDEELIETGNKTIGALFDSEVIALSRAIEQKIMEKNR